MAQALPKIIPINELKNTAKISQICKESDVPIVVTRNGYGEMVLMSVALYEKTVTDGHGTRAAAAIAEVPNPLCRAASVASVEPAADEFTLLGKILGD